MRRILVCIVASLVFPVFADVDAIVSTSISGLYEKKSTDLFTGAAENDYLSARFGGSAHIRFYSTQSRIVRARFEFITNFSASSQGSVSLLLEFPKAYIRFRVPVTDAYTLRFSLGKDVYSWGEGRIYNAADVLNGSRYETSLDVLLRTTGNGTGGTQGTQQNTQIIESTSIRNSSVWAGSAFIPIASYAFAELLFAMPNNLERGIRVVYPAQAPSPGTDKTNFLFLGNGIKDDFFLGFRTQFRIAQVKTEIGYAYRAKPLAVQKGSHQPFISLQGNLFVDWYIANAFTVDETGNFNTELSAGLFYTDTFDYVHGLRIRLETLYRIELEEAFLFFDIHYVLNELTTFSLSTEIYLVDPKAMLIFGISHDLNGLLLSFNTNMLVNSDGVYQTALAVGLSYTF